MCICKLDYCKQCDKKEKCGGCEVCKGHPLGGYCFAADLILSEGYDKYLEFKNKLIDEINNLNIEELEVNDLNLLWGYFVNLEYDINGKKIKFLNDNDIYFGNQIERKNSNRCYGVVASKEFIIVAEYGLYGADPILIKKIDR